MIVFVILPLIYADFKEIKHLFCTVSDDLLVKYLFT